MITIIFVCIILFIINFMRYEFLQEDLLFFQFFNSRNQSESKVNGKKDVVEEFTERGTSIKMISFHKSFFNVIHIIIFPSNYL